MTESGCHRKARASRPASSHRRSSGYRRAPKRAVPPQGAGSWVIVPSPPRRAKRVVTAQELAARPEVSVRTIYRDIADPRASRVPVEGEAGLGYMMRSGYELPPFMFTEDEIEALVFGARMVRAWGEMRGDFRTFRIERIRALKVTEETFKDERGKTMEDFLARPGEASYADARDRVPRVAAK
ncbi:MAG: HTH domain-containing protein [Parvibaculum sp.]|nr:HTH domain-containing protein [Parvibaculum sp.]